MTGKEHIMNLLRKMTLRYQFPDLKRTYNRSSTNNAIKFLIFMTGNEHIMDLPRTMPWVKFLAFMTGKEHFIRAHKFQFV
jgi:hypothetical protein